MSENGISISRAEDFSQWFINICVKADLADYSPVKGCMIIKPNGYAIWEKMQRILDDMLKETGHRNVYFPLLIPKSFLSKEAAHVDGFAKECAVVTHYRLKNDDQGNGVIVDPEAKLDEELIIRPTSETIIWSQYKKWIRSYRDLPLLYNQWANVVRWEMRTRLFLRTTEFLWQEGHTAHTTDQEAEEEAMQMILLYKKFCEEILAIPVFIGKKTELEKFSGAKHTYSIEAIMQDGKALQMGTSHHLGQNFSKAFDVQFQTDKGTLEYVHATSWGVSTRLMGALIMSHSDDKGLVVPPLIAETQVVIIPIFKTQEELSNIFSLLSHYMPGWKKVFSYHFDNRVSYTPGYKFAEWELKGVPLRLEIGPRDLENKTCVIVRRDKSKGDNGHKNIIKIEEALHIIQKTLLEIQNELYNKALSRKAEMSYEIESYDELKNSIDTKPGFYLAYFDDNPKAEEEIKQQLGVTTRCIPFDKNNDETTNGKCFYTGKTTKRRVWFARSY